MVVSIMWCLLQGQAGWLDWVLHGSVRVAVPPGARGSRRPAVAVPARTVVLCARLAVQRGRPYDVPVGYWRVPRSTTQTVTGRVSPPNWPGVRRGLPAAALRGWTVPGPLVVNRSVTVPEAELSWRFSRSSGPRRPVGQHDRQPRRAVLRRRARAVPAGLARAPGAGAAGRAARRRRPDRRGERAPQPAAEPRGGGAAARAGAPRGARAPRRRSAVRPGRRAGSQERRLAGKRRRSDVKRGRQGRSDD
jgi:ribosome-associated protein